MNKRFGLGIFFTFAVVLLVACGGQAPTATPTVSAPTTAPTNTPAPTAAPTNTPVPTATTAPAPTATPRPTNTPIPAPTPTVDINAARSNLPPHIFVGKARIDGELAPRGTIVAAWVGGNEAGLDVVESNGEYTLRVPFPNQMVTFTVAGFAATQPAAPTVVGGADIIDLTASSQ